MRACKGSNNFSCAHQQTIVHTFSLLCRWLSRSCAAPQAARGLSLDHPRLELPQRWTFGYGCRPLDRCVGAGVGVSYNRAASISTCAPIALQNQTTQWFSMSAFPSLYPLHPHHLDSTYQSSGELYSLGLCDTPSLLVIKIIDDGHLLLVEQVSCPAPL